MESDSAQFVSIMYCLLAYRSKYAVVAAGSRSVLMVVQNEWSRICPFRKELGIGDIWVIQI